MHQDVLVIGGGGREHALAWKLVQSPHIGKLYVAPGNGGTRRIAENVPIDPTNTLELAEFVEKNHIGLTVVGPEKPLFAGIANDFRYRGLRIFGPTQQAARIESSKAFAKTTMQIANVPTPPFRFFSVFSDEAIECMYSHGIPVVIKANQLNGLRDQTYVCKTTEELHRAFSEIWHHRTTGRKQTEIVVEDFLSGEEISIHALTDGRTTALFPPSQDHKRVCDGDQGKNTGGMGSIAPLPWVTTSMMKKIQTEIVQPVLDFVSPRDLFTGCLYPGLMRTKTGLYTLEFNARFGDPETQSYMRLLKTDLLDVLNACVDRKLSSVVLKWDPGFAVCVVLASAGYPDTYKIGFPIRGIKESERVPGVVVFHAGTAWNGKLRTAGGRVLGVTATGPTLREALLRAYEAVRRISFEGMHYRRDIGAKVFIKKF